MSTETPDARISIVIVDDHPLFRQGLGQLLRSLPQFHLLGEAANGNDGIALVKRLHPDMLLLDLNMKGVGGLDVLKAVKAVDLDTRVVMVTVSDRAEDLVAALRAGADGYLLKDMEPEDMLQSLALAASGRIIVADELTHLMASALREQARPGTAEEAGLTEQERRILDRVAQGYANKVIGRELDITEGTVKVHVKHILKKLGLRSRVEAAVWAVEQGRQG